MAKPRQIDTKGYWMFKAPLLLKQKLNEIRLERIRQGKDKELRSYKRMGLAIARHDRFLQDLINSDFMEEEK